VSLSWSSSAHVFFINDDNVVSDAEGIDDDESIDEDGTNDDNNNADDADSEQRKLLNKEKKLQTQTVFAIFSLYLTVFVVHYISSFPVAELLVVKIGIGVILLRIRHYEPNLQPYQRTYFSLHYRSNIYKYKVLIVTIIRSSSSSSLS